MCIRDRDLPWLKEQETVVIANIAGNTPEEYAQMAEKLSESSVDMIEMNISCPNVKHGGVQFGTSCQSVGAITREVRAHCKKPLMVKLSPNVSDIAETVSYTHLDVYKRQPRKSCGRRLK